MEKWKPSVKAKYGVVLFRYDGKTPHGLKLQIGDTVQINEECSGWYRGCSLRNKAIKGIFPASFIYLKKCTVENAGTQFELVTPVEDSAVSEVTSVLREWLVVWKQNYLDGNMHLFSQVMQTMLELLSLRKRILSGNVSQDQLHEIKCSITTKIDWGNGKLGLEVVPRKDGEIVDADTISVTELYDVHLKSLEDISAGQGTMRRRRSMIIPHVHNLHFEVHSFESQVTEQLEIFFSLYDAIEGKFISERFLTKLHKPLGVESDQVPFKCSTIFTDLDKTYLGRDVYLVCHLVKIGVLSTEATLRRSGNLTSTNYRRPYGCGVLNICNAFSPVLGESDEDLEYVLPIYTCNNENDFYIVHEYLIKKQTNKYNTSSVQSSYLKLKVLHGDLQQLQRENPLLFKQGISVTRKLGFPEIIMPGDIRKDFYVTIEKGEFEKGAGRNIEVSMCVVRPSGEVLKDCITLGSGEKPISEYQSFVLYHNNSPQWNEMIKLEIPISEIHGVHLWFGFKHCSRNESKDKKEKYFSFAFIKLVNKDGTILQDGTRELFLYKVDSSTDFTDHKSYLRLASCKSELNSQQNAGVVFAGPSRSTKESFTISTLVCSTKLTQNVDLLGLLKWRQHRDKLDKVLSSFLKVKGEEIVRLLQDIFECLFAILDESEHTYGSLVFQDLVFIINLLSDKKYQHFRTVLDTYIQSHFGATLAHKKLVGCLRRIVDQHTSSDKQDNLRNTINALEYLFKFIVQSRVLYARHEKDKGSVEFQEDIRQLFKAFNKMLANKSDSLLYSQEAFLSNVHLIYADVLKIMDSSKLGSIVGDMLSSIPSDAKSLLKPKLKFISATVQSDLFQKADAQNILMPLLSTQLHTHLVQRQEIKLTSEVLGNIVTALSQTVKTGSLQDTVFLLVKTLLQITFQVVMTVDRKGPFIGQLMADLIGMLKLMSEQHYKMFLELFTSKKDLKDFLLKVFVVFTDLVKRDVFPREWKALVTQVNNVMLSAVQNFSQALIDSFLGGEDFDQQLWSSYFNLCISFLTQDSLQLENFTEVKRMKILDRYGDMRQVIGFEIVDMWQNLGDNIKVFIPGIIGPLLEMTLIPETELRKATIPIFYDLIECEFKNKRHLREVESEMIDKLDIFVSENKGDEQYKDLFYAILNQKLKDNPDIQVHGLEFVNSITQLLERLVDYRYVMQGDESVDLKMACTVNLLEYYRDIGRLDMYIRYIYKLCDLHLSQENYTEAACTLLLHAKVLRWKHQVLPAQGKYPEQTEWARKEMLYKDIVDYCDKGKNWEMGISLLRKLEEVYEDKTYEYRSLSEVLRKEAQFFVNIMKELRPEPEYFRVGFFGKGFPSFVRNKAFIFRGLAYERIGSFNRRLASLFPNAQLMMRSNPPQEDVLQSESQYLESFRVIPVPSKELPEKKKNRIVSEKILNYYKVNKVNKFTYSRPFHKEKKDKSNEFATMWIERTTFHTTSDFPGVLQWFQIAKFETVEISPIENAIETIVTKSAELKTIITRLKDDSSQSANPLSMILNGIIDAAVNGGLTNYEKAFFSNFYTLKYPDHTDKITRLKEAIGNQVDVVEDGLHLHERLSTKDLKPFHDKMTVQFEKMKTHIQNQGIIKKQPKRKTSAPPSMGLALNSPESVYRGLIVSHPNLHGGRSLESISSLSPDSNRATDSVFLPIAEIPEPSIHELHSPVQRRPSSDPSKPPNTIGIQSQEESDRHSSPALINSDLMSNRALSSLDSPKLPPKSSVDPTVPSNVPHRPSPAKPPPPPLPSEENEDEILPPSLPPKTLTDTYVNVKELMAMQASVDTESLKPPPRPAKRKSYDPRGSPTYPPPIIQSPAIVPDGYQITPGKQHVIPEYLVTSPILGKGVDIEDTRQRSGYEFVTPKKGWAKPDQEHIDPALLERRKIGYDTLPPPRLPSDADTASNLRADAKQKKPDVESDITTSEEAPPLPARSKRPPPPFVETADDVEPPMPPPRTPTLNRSSLYADYCNIETLMESKLPCSPPVPIHTPSLSSSAASTDLLASREATPDKEGITCPSSPLRPPKIRTENKTLPLDFPNLTETSDVAFNRTKESKNDLNPDSPGFKTPPVHKKIMFADTTEDRSQWIPSSTKSDGSFSPILSPMSPPRVPRRLSSLDRRQASLEDYNMEGSPKPRPRSNFELSRSFSPTFSSSSSRSSVTSPTRSLSPCSDTEDTQLSAVKQLASSPEKHNMTSSFVEAMKEELFSKVNEPKSPPVVLRRAPKPKPRTTSAPQPINVEDFKTYFKPLVEETPLPKTPPPVRPKPKARLSRSSLSQDKDSPIGNNP